MTPMGVLQARQLGALGGTVVSTSLGPAAPLAAVVLGATLIPVTTSLRAATTVVLPVALVVGFPPLGFLIPVVPGATRLPVRGSHQVTLKPRATGSASQTRAQDLENFFPDFTISDYQLELPHDNIRMDSTFVNSRNSFKMAQANGCEVLCQHQTNSAVRRRVGAH
jgi:hypothetical protein